MPFCNTAGLERNAEIVCQIVVPTHRLFFGAVGIDYDFHCDTFFAHFIFLNSLHRGNTFHSLQGVR